VNNRLKSSVHFETSETDSPASPSCISGPSWSFGLDSCRARDTSRNRGMCVCPNTWGDDWKSDPPRRDVWSKATVEIVSPLLSSNLLLLLGIVIQPCEELAGCWCATCEATRLHVPREASPGTGYRRAVIKLGWLAVITRRNNDGHRSTRIFLKGRRDSILDESSSSDERERERDGKMFVQQL